MHSLYDQELFSDVKILFSGKTFRGHKAILCRRSKYFEKALTGKFTVSRADFNARDKT